ncbi:hypothetical protein QR680_017574 [Steinernema hermaphroditum]|uniref:G-protein coupled receptors family 1 profile domain-containing protein n=1 Tax=Steinernema hermaphroditum TaxID=289476 RepID=A0AA39HF33_9BILA|nr:hypothetical protein QR680_017574 [Steinernema hermaphroditum]
MANHSALLLATMAEDSDFDDSEPLLNLSPIRAFFIVAYAAVFLSSIVGNTVILIVLLLNSSMRTITNFFLGNLAIADLLVGIFCVLPNAVHFVLLSHGTWPFGELMCHCYVYIIHLIPNSSAGILVLLSIERFIAVLRPMLVHHLMTKTVLAIAAVLCWLISGLMNLPYFFAVRYIDSPRYGNGSTYSICTRKHIQFQDFDVLKVVTTVNFVFWYMVPLGLLGCIYITIGVALLRSTGDGAVARSSLRSSKSNQSQMTKKKSAYQSLGENIRETSKRLLSSKCRDADEEANEQRRSTSIEAIDSRRKVIRLVSVIVISFALLSFPRYSYLIWSVWRDNSVPRCLNCVFTLIHPLTFLLLFINSGINPLLYAFLSVRFRTAIKETFFCHSQREKKQSKIVMGLRGNHANNDHENIPIARVGYHYRRMTSTEHETILETTVF